MLSEENKEEAQGTLNLNPEIVQSEPTLPPLVPPQTKTPSQINQINIHQIPPRAWDKLAPDQIVALTSKIIDQADRMDSRHFEIAKQQSLDSGKNGRIAVMVGGGVAVVGLGTVAYLAASGNPNVAAVIGTFLATSIAVVVGRKLSD